MLHDLKTRPAALALALLLFLTSLSVQAEPLDATEDDLLPALPALPSPTGPQQSSHDTTDPTITSLALRSHYANQWYNDDTVDLRLHADDHGGSGIQGTSETLTGTPDCTVDRPHGDGWQSFTVTTGRFGDYTYRVRPVDNEGNCGEDVSVRFRVDTIPPEVTEVQPREGETVDSTTREILVWYQDTDDGMDPQQESPVSTHNVRLFVDGAERTSQALRTETYLHYVSPLGFTVGDHVVEVRVSDTSIGAQSTVKTWTFRVNPVAGFDADGDLIPDAAEKALCLQEVKGFDADGTCTGPGAGDDYTPPGGTSPLDLVGEGSREVTRFLNSITGQVGNGAVHFN